MRAFAFLVTTLTLVACDPTPPRPSGVSRSATVSWDAPGDEDLAGFRVYGTYSLSPADEFSSVVDQNADSVYRPVDSRSFVVNDLEPGFHYFQVTALDESGNESEPSPVVTKRIDG